MDSSNTVVIKPFSRWDGSEEGGSGGRRCVCIYIYIYMYNYDWGASQVALVVKNLPANAGDSRDLGLIPALGRPPGIGNDNPL